MSIRSCLIVLGLSVIFCASSIAAETINPQVELKTSAGTVVLELYPDAAPKTVKNFLQYVNSGFYQGTVFHRVINNFMIQGGGMGPDLKEKKKNAPIPLEALQAFEHGLKNEIGTIAMAREEKPDTADSEFFINVANNDFLDPVALPAGDPVKLMRRGELRTMSRAEALATTAGYTVFGRVIAGMEIVNKIKLAPTDRIGQNMNVPRQPITVLSAKVLKTPITPKTIDQQLQPATPVATLKTNVPTPVVPATPG